MVARYSASCGDEHLAVLQRCPLQLRRDQGLLRSLKGIRQMFDLDIQRFDSGGHVDACLISSIDPASKPTQHKQANSSNAAIIASQRLIGLRCVTTVFFSNHARTVISFRSLVAREHDYPVETVRDLNCSRRVHRRVLS